MSTQQQLALALKKNKSLETKLEQVTRELQTEKWFAKGLHDYTDRLHKKYKRLKKIIKQATLSGKIKL